MSRVNRRDSLRLLGTALDGGITHFDTARSYGFGEAESVLGEFSRNRREQVTITTKVGILPPARSPWLPMAKTAARTLINMVPSARRYVRHGAGKLLPTQRFDTAAMAKSLETSLLALKTGYVDFLLLHEPRLDVLRSDEPLAFLQRVREQGKVRFTGVATDLPGVPDVLSTMPGYAEVVQQPYRMFSQTREGAASSGGGAVIAYGCLGALLAALRAELQADRSLGAAWSRSLHLDVTGPGRLEQLTLLTACADLPRAAILFSSTSPQHTRANAAAFEAAASPDQVEHFRTLVLTRSEAIQSQASEPPF